MRWCVWGGVTGVSCAGEEERDGVELISSGCSRGARCRSHLVVQVLGLDRGGSVNIILFGAGSNVGEEGRHVGLEAQRLRRDQGSVSRGTARCDVPPYNSACTRDSGILSVPRCMT